MPKTIQVRNFFDITEDEWRVIIAVETGMRNHEYVDLDTIHRFSAINFNGGSFVKILKNILIPKRIIAYDNNAYRLTNLGYDFLALHSFVKAQILSDLSFFQLIGTGKESDIYICKAGEGSVERAGINFKTPLVLKFHRLGRTSFKQVKNKREYKQGNNCSWIYMNRISASREFITMQALFAANIPVPIPVIHNRGAVVMEYLKNSYPLFKFSKTVLKNGAAILLFREASKILTDMAQLGLVHGDLNEFNLMVETNDNGDDNHIDSYQDDQPNEHSDDEEEDNIDDGDCSASENSESEYSDNEESDFEDNDNDCCPYINDDINSFKLRVIDFPQVISRDNKTAQEIYTRDRGGIISFFERFADLRDSDLPPQFIEDIKRTKYLDVKLKAPGHPKKQDLRRQNITFESDIDSEEEIDKTSNKFFLTAEEIKRRKAKEKLKKGRNERISKQQRNSKKGEFRNNIKFEL